MADNDQKSGIGLADIGADDVAAKPASSGSGQTPSPSGGSLKPELVYFGRPFFNGQVRIDSIIIGGQPTDGTSAVIYRNSEIIIRGGGSNEGLNLIDEWEIERSGKNSLVFAKVISQTQDQVILNMADAIGGSLEDKENVGLGFYAGKISRRGRRLNFILKYNGAKAEDQNNKAKSLDDDKPTGSGSTGLTIGALGGVLSGVAGNAAGNIKPQGTAGSAVQPTSQTVSGTNSAGQKASGGSKVINTEVTSSDEGDESENQTIEQETETTNTTASHVTTQAQSTSNVSHAVSGGGGTATSKTTATTEVRQKQKNEVNAKQEANINVEGSSEDKVQAEAKQNITQEASSKQEVLAKDEKSQEQNIQAKQKATGDVENKQSVNNKKTIKDEPAGGGQLANNSAGSSQGEAGVETEQNQEQKREQSEAQSPQGQSSANQGVKPEASALKPPVGLKKMEELDAERKLKSGPAADVSSSKSHIARKSPSLDAERVPGQNEPGKIKAEPQTGQGARPSTGEPGKEGKNLPKPDLANQQPEAEEEPESEQPEGLDLSDQNRPDDTVVRPTLGPDSLRRAPDGQTGNEPVNKNPVDATRFGADKGLSSPSATNLGGGGITPSVSPQPGEANAPGTLPDLLKGSSPRFQKPRNVFKDPRKPEGEDPFREKNNPAAYATTRRLIDKKSELAGKGIGQASSKIWYYGFSSSSATFFTGLDFMLGAIVMDAYWIFGHRKQPELFPLKRWQKIVTIAANIIPPILIVLIFGIILVAGCNWPVPKSNLLPTYRGTAIGLIIGDSCKPFDMANLRSSGGGGGTSGGAGASDTFSTPPAASGPIAPLGPAASSASSGNAAPPANTSGNTSGILSFIKSWNGTEVYPAVDWGNSDPNIAPAIKANLSELQGDFNNLNKAWQNAGHVALAPKQVYRPEIYQEHYRSIWEIFAVVNNKDNTQGYLCDQTSHLDPTAVKQAYSQASAGDKQILQGLYTAHEISLTSTPAGCVSDHASGMAMDIADQAIDGFDVSLYPVLKTTAQNYGLCHNISGDQPHFALTIKLPDGTNCSQP